MTDILCKWLNDELQISKRISPAMFAQEFSSGFLLGEVLYRYQLQDDFDQFSPSSTADSKLNNFTRLEPIFHLLGIPFDTTTARDIMTEKHGTATRLLYQMYIALNNKKKASLTGVAMQTLQSAAVAKLGAMESEMFKERLKRATPRQADLNLQALVDRFHEHQTNMEQMAFKMRFEESEHLRQQRQNERQCLIDRSRKLREKQTELVAKIAAATLEIPKPPRSKTLKTIETRMDMRKKREAEETISAIHFFEEKMRAVLPPQKEDSDIDLLYEENEEQHVYTLKVTMNDEYIGKIRKRLQEDALAREEREKRRRKVLTEQMSAHLAQEEARREEMLVNRLMRQSQQERRIVVQLLQTRREKEVIRQNRILREKQFQERREKDFEEALDREAEAAALYKQKYAEQIRADQELHDQIAAQRTEMRYRRHYDMCAEIVQSIVDFAVKVAEYREITNNLIPNKLMREWQLLFTSGLPLFEHVEQEIQELSPEKVLEEERQQMLDEGDFLEYKGMNGEWAPPENSEVTQPPRDNPVVSHIVHILFNIVHPPTPPAVAPELPQFPVRACVLGKAFSGKTTCIKRLAMEYSLHIVDPEVLIKEAIAAYEAGEVETADEAVQASFSENFENVSTVHDDLIAGSEINNNDNMTKDGASMTFIDTDVTKQVSQSDVEEQSSHEISVTQQESEDLPKPVSTVKINKPAQPERTVRAKLGAKALKCLKKGKPVEDQVVADILLEEIRKIPEGTGWIMDGYPHSYAQAKLLERALSGCDADIKENKKAQRSSLLQKPESQSSTPHSGIDVVILFDIRDELCLRRAAGRSEQIQTGRTFHVEFEPPPEGSLTGIGKREQVQPVCDQAFSEQQLQTRLTGFVDNWPKLKKWFTKFGTLKTVDASLEKEAVFLETEKILEDTLVRLQQKDQPPLVEEAAVEEKLEEQEKVASGPPETPLASQKEETATGHDDMQTPRLSSKSAETEETIKTGVSTTSKESKADKSVTEEEVKSSDKISVQKIASEAKSEGKLAPEKKKPDVEFNVTFSIGLGSARSRSSSKEKKSKSPKGRKSDSNVKRRESKGGGKPGKPTEPEPQSEAEVPVEPPPPQPGDEDWIFVEPHFDIDLAKVLMLHWEEMEHMYVNNCKTVFRNIRIERENIFRYFYQIKKDFIQILKKPDSKQEYITQWQKIYNDVADDMRADEDVKAEFHQQVDDLVEKLWSICDNRKEQAEKEREAIMKDGWLEDRIGLLSNHYLTLMQAEIDRFQDTVRLLKDYYGGIVGLIPDALNPVYDRAPLLELPFEAPEKRPVEPSASENEVMSEKDERQSQSSAQSPRDSKTLLNSKKKEPEQEEDDKPAFQFPKEYVQRTIIPLVPRQPVHPIADRKSTKPSARESKEKVSSRKPRDEQNNESPMPAPLPDERYVSDGYNFAVNAISTMTQNEMLVKAAEEEAERQQEQERIREREKALKLAIKGARPSGKKGPQQSTSPRKVYKGKDIDTSSFALDPASFVANEEEMQKKIRKSKARDELYFAIQEEAQAATTRLDLIRFLACVVLQDLRNKGEEAFKILNDWLGARFLKEMEGINNMVLVMWDAIERGEKIKQDMMFEMGSFIVDEDLKVLKTPTPEPQPSPREEPMADQFTVDQFKNLYEQLKAVAPGGIISRKAFTEMLETLILVAHGTETLPDQWMHFNSAQIQDLSNILSSESDYIDWHRLLVALCYSIPLPSQHQLLECLQRFKKIDQRDTGTVTREQWHWVMLWFTLDPDSTETFNRVARLKSVLFDVFADYSGPIPLLDYVEFLMYFSASANYHEGFLRALSVATGQHMPRLDKPVLPIAGKVKDLLDGDLETRREDKTIVEPPMSDEIIPPEAKDAEVPLKALFKVLTESLGQQTKPGRCTILLSTCLDDSLRQSLLQQWSQLRNMLLDPLQEVLHHGDTQGGDSHRYCAAADTEDHRSIERLAEVYQELNDDDSTAPIMYRVLIEHPLIQDVVVACKQFKAVDLMSLIPKAGPEVSEIPSFRILD